jgi:hypothetical protein
VNWIEGHGGHRVTISEAIAYTILDELSVADSKG